MKKKKTKLFSWTVASVAALTLLCGTWASAAVSLTSGADGIYLRNSGKDYTLQVDAPKNHFVGIRVDGVYLMGEKAPVQIDIEVGGTAPVVTPAPETQAPSSTKTPTTEAPAATTAVPTYVPPRTSEAPEPAPTPSASEEPTASEDPVETSTGAWSYSAGVQSAVSELPIQALVNLAAPAEANAETYYATIGIPASYLDTLSDGSHTVVMDFVEGSVSTTITVTSDASMLTNGNPSTGDTTHVLPYVLLAAGSACVLVFLAKKEKKETR